MAENHANYSLTPKQIQQPHWNFTHIWYRTRREGMAKSLQVFPRGEQRSCRDNMLWQTAADSSISDVKHSVTDGRHISTVRVGRAQHHLLDNSHSCSSKLQTVQHIFSTSGPCENTCGKRVMALELLTIPMMHCSTWACRKLFHEYWKNNSWKCTKNNMYFRKSSTFSFPKHIKISTQQYKCNISTEQKPSSVVNYDIQQ